MISPFSANLRRANEVSSTHRRRWKSRMLWNTGWPAFAGA